MSGQPEKFSVVKVLAKETSATGLAQEPAIIVLAGDKLTLKTYMNVNADIPTNGFVELALVPNGTVTYYFEDLDSGGAPISKAGGKIEKLSADDVAIAFGTKTAAPTNPNVVQDELKKFNLKPDGVWFLSAPTADITTGKAAGFDLVVLPPETSAAWRVLTAVWGTPVIPNQPAQVGAHDDDLLIQVTT